ncbi:arsenate reductase/protein-tyrosine-phosphatase family protein [Beduini massiliensis]|uniref:arsenate reductase/protein-tyrosine-phosphatase family protein n=1 Tax=Beduini massiliensis TaxID=1585974 RepID=UPI00059A96B1|nr:low molecular weight phosphatase family protein [Beduini massiliensis]
MKKKIAFVCVHNACRSQIAEALGNKFLSEKYAFYSCGTKIKSEINPDAIRLMKEIYAIDMEKTHYCKLMEEIPDADIIISMGCQVECPYIGREFDENWQLEDPTGKGDIVFRETIRKIEDKIKLLHY